MPDLWKSLAVNQTLAQDALKLETIQSLWSGYGEIFRLQLIPESLGSLIVKQVTPPTSEHHPRGWNTDRSQLRKLRSYEVESYWYTQWSQHCNDQCRVAKHIGSATENCHSVILLEDLDASGYFQRHSQLLPTQAKTCLNWLAHFHAQFMHSTANGLWPIGSYWHLDTRPDEYAAMKPGKIKTHAHKIDQLLNNCEYQTIVHGDAKVANFCFNKNSTKAAAVDFQYVGGGCGMKDVAYFFGSCFNEHECEQYVPALLDYYFDTLSDALTDRDINTLTLEEEWRKMFAPAWTDFHRFLLGWMPGHAKIHSYTESLALETLALVEGQNK